MATVEGVTVGVHVAAGSLALLAGFAALATTKGGRRHRRAGRVFVASMGVVVGTTFLLLALAPTRFRVFLALVAVFSGYLALSGYRVLSRRRPTDGATALDRVAAVAVVLACLGLGGWGVAQFVDGSAFGAVMVVFGTIGLAFGASDARTFWTESTGGPRTVTHLQRMLAALVATVSAVSAVNLTPYLGVAAWLWPTAVGVPLIAYWARRYQNP